MVLGGFDQAYCAASHKDMTVPFQHPDLDTRIKELSSQPPEVTLGCCGINFCHSSVVLGF